jgi:transposase
LSKLGSGDVAARCVLIMDRAPYHTQKFGPNDSPLNMVKRKMLNWLKVNCPKQRGYNSFTKMDVLKIIVRKELAKMPTTVERFLEGHGHKVFYLPPAHPRLNPIESVWAQMKAHIRKVNDVNMTFKKMEALIRDTGVNVVKNRNVVKYYQHALKVENHYRKDDQLFIEKTGTVHNIPYDVSHVEEWDSKEEAEDKEEDEEEIGTQNRRSKRLKTG